MRCKKNEKTLEECLTPSVKHGGGNVMFWGSFGGSKVGDLYRVKGTLKKPRCHPILQRHAIPCGRRLIGANFLLQQDRARGRVRSLVFFSGLDNNDSPS